MKSRNQREGTFVWRYVMAKRYARDTPQLKLPNDGKFRWIRQWYGFGFVLLSGQMYQGVLSWSKDKGAYAFYGFIPSIYVPHGTKWHEAQAYVVARMRLEV